MKSSLSNFSRELWGYELGGIGGFCFGALR